MHRGPVDVQPGDVACATCAMGIVEMRFKAQGISPKGKRWHFDSIECLMRWKRDDPHRVAHAWVTDTYHPAQWLELERAFFLRSQTLPSPMGAFLSAYATPQDLQKAQQAFGGTAVTLRDLEEGISSP
ncbi:MAG: nitrous oxide reductase accessory protein NosL [Deltaproteobacteria bacterium]|nr:nitrous oxide reductase accessory protein NosL [Deltaproteobacteria bacterium]